MLPWPVTWSPGRSSGIVAGFESNVPRIGPREDIVVLLSRMMLIPHIQASSLMERFFEEKTPYPGGSLPGSTRLHSVGLVPPQNSNMVLYLHVVCWFPQATFYLDLGTSSNSDQIGPTKYEYTSLIEASMVAQRAKNTHLLIWDAPA
ncbi:unnamed protein product [Urochloa humidicola]